MIFIFFRQPALLCTGVGGVGVGGVGVSDRHVRTKPKGIGAVVTRDQNAVFWLGALQ